MTKAQAFAGACGLMLVALFIVLIYLAVWGYFVLVAFVEVTIFIAILIGSAAGIL